MCEQSKRPQVCVAYTTKAKAFEELLDRCCFPKQGEPGRSLMSESLETPFDHCIANN